MRQCFNSQFPLWRTFEVFIRSNNNCLTVTICEWSYVLCEWNYDLFCWTYELLSRTSPVSRGQFGQQFWDFLAAETKKLFLELMLMEKWITKCEMRIIRSRFNFYKFRHQKNVLLTSRSSRFWFPFRIQFKPKLQTLTHFCQRISSNRKLFFIIFNNVA